MFRIFFLHITNQKITCNAFILFFRHNLNFAVNYTARIKIYDIRSFLLPDFWISAFPQKQMFQQLISVGKMHYKQQILFCLQQILNLLFFLKNSQNLITNNPIKQSNPRNSKHSRCQKRDCIQTYINWRFRWNNVLIYKKNKRHSYHRTDHKIHCHVQNFLSQLSRSLSFYVLPFYFNTFYKLFYSISSPIITSYS